MDCLAEDENATLRSEAAKIRFHGWLASRVGSAEKSRGGDAESHAPSGAASSSAPAAAASSSEPAVACGVSQNTHEHDRHGVDARCLLSQSGKSPINHISQ